MVNERHVLTTVRPLLNDKKQILKEDFKKLFSGLKNDELKDILVILKKNNIEVVLDSGGKIQNVSKVPSKNFKKLSNEQLCMLYKQGNKEVLSAIIEKNENLIWSRVKKYSNIFNHKLDEEDLFQSGAMGLIKAIERYDPKRGANLSTYSIYWIDQRINRDIFELGFTIRIPIHMAELVLKVNAILSKNQFKQKNDIIQIIKNEGISEEKFNVAMVLRNNILKIASINTLVSEDEDSELINFIEDSEYFLEDEVLRSILKEDLQKAISELKENEQFVLNMRFGLEDGRAKTLEEVGQAYGVTRERIRQIEVKALGKLRKSKKAKYLREYLIEG